MKDRPVTPGNADLAGSTQPLAIVLTVLLLGASFYLCRMGYLRSRAALIALAAVFAALIYVGFFSQPGY